VNAYAQFCPPGRSDAYREAGDAAMAKKIKQEADPEAPDVDEEQG
jgi:hypothetical protein